MEKKKFRIKTSLLPTVPKVYAHGCKPELKIWTAVCVFPECPHRTSHVQYQIFTNMICVRLSQTPCCSESCSNSSQCFTHKYFLNYKFSMQKNQELKTATFLAECNSLITYKTISNLAAIIEELIQKIVSPLLTEDSKQLREWLEFPCNWRKNAFHPGLQKENTEEALPLVIFTYLRAVYIKQLIPTCNSKIRHFQVSKTSQASGMNTVKPCLMPLFPTISCTSAVCTYY